VSRACIFVKSDGNITRALPLLSSGLNVGVSSWHCLAGSPNGAAGSAFGVILERARSISLRRCAPAANRTVRLSSLTVRALFLVWHRLNERGDASDHSAFI
jgi:hypothetical protein